MSKVTIEVAGYELDLAKDISFGLNYAISDVKKPEKKNSNYSKTITLSGSKNNNKFFANLYDVNADFTFFNPNIKTDAKIVIDSSTVLDGFLRLNSIEKDTDSNLSGNKIVYKCTVSSKSADFFSNIKDKDLSELDFTRYDHEYTKANVESSWTHTSNDVYTYPLLHKGSNDYVTKDFTPAIFHKAYLKRIAQEAGYTLGGSLLDESTGVGFHYSKEIIPYNGDAPILNEVEADRREFKVGLTNVSQEIIKFVTDNNLYFAPSNFLDNDTTNGNFDNDNNYDTVTYINTIDADGSYAFQLRVNTKVTVDSTNSIDLPLDSSLTHHIYYLLFVNGVQQGVMYLPITDIPDINAGTGYIGTKEVIGAVNFPPLNLVVGDEVQVFNQVAFNMSALYNSAGAEVTYDVLKTNTSFLNVPQRHTLTDEDDVVLGDFIPKEIKQSDIISDLVTRYNAYISIDEDNDRKLIIDDRDSYYSKGVNLDWSDKRDYGSKAVIKLLSELQQKEIDFSYTADDDDYNKNYSKATNGDVYGVKKIEFDNEFVKGVNKITTPFAPTPLIFNSPNPVAVIPAITTVEPKNKIRVLYYGGLINCINSGSWNLESYSGGVQTITNYTTYPYAGHYDNPITPNIDINFGEVPYTWYNGATNNTNANQYNRFWSNYVNQINEGKLVTYRMNLNEVDIYFIKNNLNARIYINDAWYYINKIVDYDPINLGLTKVEFNKINEGVSFVSENTEFAQILTESEIIERIAGLEETTSNLSRSSNVSMTGSNNYIGKDSEGSVISGDNNYIADNVPDGFIIGASNKSISVAGEGWIGDVKYVDGFPVNDIIHQVIVNQDNFRDTLGGVINSEYEYFIDGVIDMGDIEITVPTGGISLRGSNFDISGLVSSVNDYTMFVSETPVIGSGNLLATDLLLTTSGTNSKVYELYDPTESKAIEVIRVNYNNCNSLGDLHTYRQGLETGTGRFGGTPELTLHGNWAGGYRVSTSIVRGLTDGIVFSLFSAGTLFVMNSRFLTDINCDLPNKGILLDFSDTNFPNPSTLELRDCIITRNGLTVPNDLAITPNITASNLSCSWKGNNGVGNTFVGAIATISTEVLTVITSSTNPTALLGTVTTSDLQHFDSPANGQLRHLGNNPKEYTVNFDFVLEGAQNRDYAIQLIKNDGTDTQIYQQIRVVNNFAGGRDVAYFTGLANVILNKDEYLFWNVENLSNNANCTLELDSSWSVEER